MNVTKTHGDTLPLPGQSIKDVQLAVAPALRQSTINIDGLRFGVISGRVPPGARRRWSARGGPHWVPEIMVCKRRKRGVVGVLLCLDSNAPPGCTDLTPASIGSPCRFSDPKFLHQ